MLVNQSTFYRESAGEIDIATKAVAQFLVACKDLDIDVAVIDFYDDEAWYVKPLSADTEHAQQSILNSDTKGRTLLADALSLARSVAGADSKESLLNLFRVLADQMMTSHASDAFAHRCSSSPTTN